MTSAADAQPCGTAVVCGVDDSGEALEAIRVADRLSDALGLRLILVHVGRITPVPRTRLGAALVADALDHFRAIAIEAGRELLERQSARAEVDRGERRVVIGELPLALVEEAVREDAAAIVVGSRGRGALARAVLGSVSAEVVSAAPCPVVVVRSEAADPSGRGS